MPVRSFARRLAKASFCASVVEKTEATWRIFHRGGPHIDVSTTGKESTTGKGSTTGKDSMTGSEGSEGSEGSGREKPRKFMLRTGTDDADRAPGKDCAGKDRGAATALFLLHPHIPSIDIIETSYKKTRKSKRSKCPTRRKCVADHIIEAEITHFQHLK
jgi:hypothetical protein